MTTQEPLASMSTGLSPTSNFFDHLESLIKSQIPDQDSALDVCIKLGTPIVSVAVMEEGNTTARLIGSPTPRENDTTLDNNTIFQAASISKPLTSLAVIKLCQEETLNLDTPISEYLTSEQLTWISTPKSLALASGITLRQLLSHTSGLSGSGFPGYPATSPTIQQILTGSPPCNSEPIAPFIFPGQAFSYSGGGFTVIQLILETVLKKPFAQIMDDIVLQPLGLSRSTYEKLPSGEKNYAPAYLTGKLKSDPDHHFLPESAAAGLWTTPSDLLRVIHAVQKSLESDNFLEQKWAKLMLTVLEDNKNMALGWRVDEEKISFSHTGANDPGYYCIVLGYADLGVDPTVEDKTLLSKACGISVMTSSVLGNSLMVKITQAVQYLKGWAAPEFSSHAIPFMDRSKTIDKTSSEWAGKWTPGNWNVISDGSGMSIQSGKTPAIPLIPAAIPPQSFKEGTSIDLVVDGLEMLLRLSWKNGYRVIELVQHGESKILERAK